MPLYEYDCSACHKRTEKIQKFSDPEITVCPRCGGHLERVLSAPAISFKGGGWYADGYGNAKPAASSESGSGSGSAESKPASDGASSTENKSAVDKVSPAPAAATPAASTPAPAASNPPAKS